MIKKRKKRKQKGKKCEKVRKKGKQRKEHRKKKGHGSRPRDIRCIKPSPIFSDFSFKKEDTRIRSQIEREKREKTKQRQEKRRFLKEMEKVFFSKKKK